MDSSMGLRSIAAKTIAFSLLSSVLSLQGCKVKQDSTAQSSIDSAAVKAGAVSEADMGGLVELRNEVLAVTNRAELDAFLTKLASSYQSMPPEAKFVATQMLLVVPLKSIVYRVTPLLKSVNATHSVLLTVAQQVASTVNIFAPTPQWKALVAYINEPDAAGTKQYQSIEELQIDAEAVMMPKLVQAIADITAINVTDAKPIVWDNKFLFGSGSFADAHDRFSKIGAAEKQQALGSLERALLGLRVGCAYNLSDALVVGQKIGMIFGVDGYLLNSVQGAPMAARIKAVESTPNFLKLRVAPAGSAGNGAALMAAALGDYRASVKAASDQFAAVKARSSALAGQSDDFWGINPPAVLAYERVTNLALQEATAIAAGPAQVTSLITGETVNVNVPAFFTSPPPDLKVFLPTAFVAEETTTAQGISVRNYLWGSPTAWNPQAYAPYLPSVQAPGDVAVVARVLSESRGGAGVLAAMSSFVN